MPRCALLLPTLALAVLSAAEPVAIPPTDAAAGGWAGGGPLGSYFANPGLAGEPAFTRRDVRIDFRWGERLPVGGSPASPLRDFPRQRFSVRWAGSVVPRFSEPYVFTCSAGSGFRLRLRPAVGGDWIAACDRWGQGGRARSQPVQLEAGRPCAVELEYRQEAGPALAALAWSCPSVPEQVIDPVAAQGLNASSWVGHCWADEMLCARFTRGEQDGQGFPTGDTGIFAGEGRPGSAGTYALSFRGQAAVARRGSAFTAGTQSWKDAAPRGAGWDAASGTTRLLVDHATNEDAWTIELTQTARDGGAPVGNGLSAIRLMRPVQAGAGTPHRDDEIVYRPFKAAAEPFTCLRWLQIANQKCDGRWGDRTLPGQREFTRGGFWNDNGGGECWERLVVLANECGKDLYVCLPMQADDAYVEQFARLVRFGSDGTEPYDHEVDGPAWPPLNPNLRLYVEIGNEIWNWGFASTQACRERAEREIRGKTADGRIIDYDGKGDYRRWHALRTVRAADIFRRVMGTEAVGGRVRMLMEYQYDNYQNTASGSLGFLDAWFNNGDGDHVADPHPPRHWLWGAGGATYYGLGNGDGRQDGARLADPGFEAGMVPAGGESANPAGSGWICGGAAAIYRNWQVSVAGFVPGQPGRVAQAAAAGCSLTVAEPTVVRALGCWLRARTGVHTLVLLGPGGPLAQVAVKPQQIAISEVDSWVWGPTAGDPVRLLPGITYHLLARAEKGEPQLFTEPVELVAGPGFSIAGAARVAAGGADPAGWQVVTSPGGRSFGPVALRCSAGADAQPTGLPEPVRGGQAAVLRPGGSLATTITFPRAGRYALALHAAGRAKGWPGYLPFRITVGSRSANPSAQGDERSGDQFVLGGFHRRTDALDETWGSAVFSIDKAGEAPLVITAGTGGDWVVFDDITVASVEALLDSGFGSGQAFGQVAQDDYARQLDAQSGYALSFGLPVVAYEAGWSLGGDFHAKPIHSWAKFREERVRGINDTAEDVFRRAGGFMNVWGVYLHWPAHDLAAAATYPLWRSVAGLSSRLPAEAAIGTPAPCTLGAPEAIRWSYGDRGWKGGFAQRGEWRSWLVRLPAGGIWELAVDSCGAGGWELEVDGIRVGAGGAGSPPAAVCVAPGLHGLRLRAVGAFDLAGIAIRPRAR